MGRLFQNLAFAQSGTGNNWAKGHYTEGAEMADEILDMTRKESEMCDSLHAFQIIHSLGGGTGSGLGTLLIDKLREEYPTKQNCSFTVMPHITVTSGPTDPYNVVFAMHHLIENTDTVMCLDNKALFDICYNNLKLSSPKYEDVNHIAQAALSGITCSLRFPGNLNSDMRKLAMNLQLFPRLHFYVPGLAPFTSLNSQHYQPLTVPELYQASYNAQNMLCSIDPRHGRYLTLCLTFRGLHSLKEIDEQVVNVSNRNSSYFVEWVPCNIKYMNCDIVPEKGELKLPSVTSIASTTAIQNMFVRLGEQFSNLYHRRAYVHWYRGEGMDEYEFEEAESNMNDLVSEYLQYQNYTDDSADQIDDEEQME